MKSVKKLLALFAVIGRAICCVRCLSFGQDSVVSSAGTKRFSVTSSQISTQWLSRISKINCFQTQILVTNHGFLMVSYKTSSERNKANDN